MRLGISSERKLMVLAPIGLILLGVGQEQITLKPMVEMIESQFEESPFANGCLLTADTSDCNEEKQKVTYLDRM